MVYGVSEAPRLWYEKAKEELHQVGFLEVDFSPATFILTKVRNEKKVVVAILCLHVDDGLLVVELGETCNGLRKEIDSQFNIKEWIKLSKAPAMYLGMHLSYTEGGFVTDMTDYILAIDAAAPPEAREQDYELYEGWWHS